MGLYTLSDDDVFALAKPILLDTIIGANNKDWAQFSRHMPAEDASNAETQADVERQWEEDPYLTQFTDKPEFLGVIRKSDVIIVLWKLRCSDNNDEHLERLYLQEHEGKVVQVGIWTD